MRKSPLCQVDPLIWYFDEATGLIVVRKTVEKCSATRRLSSWLRSDTTLATLWRGKHVRGSMPMYISLLNFTGNQEIGNPILLHLALHVEEQDDKLYNLTVVARYISITLTSTNTTPHPTITPSTLPPQQLSPITTASLLYKHKDITSVQHPSCYTFIATCLRHYSTLHITLSQP
jgi:hypothetical protein